MTDYDKLSNNALYTREYFHQEDICRLCWSKDANNELFSRMIFCTLKSPLFFKVQSCLGIDLSEDDSEYHPRKICEICFFKLEQFNDFKAFCQNSNQKLNAILNGTDNSESKLNLKNESLKDPIKIEKNEENLIDIIDLIDAESLDSFPDGFHNFDTDVENFETHVENVTETSPIFDVNITEPPLPPANQSQKKNNLKPAKIPEKNEILLVSTQPTCSSKNLSELGSEKTTSTLNKTSGSPRAYCNTCYIVLKDEEVYLNHNSEAHGIERNGKFRCFGCGKLFNNRKTRSSHESYYCKSLEFGFRCNICGRYLPLRGSYDKHINDHRLNKIKDEPNDSAGIFKCYKCNERFTRRSKWCEHMAKHKREDRKDVICTTTTSAPQPKLENKETPLSNCQASTSLVLSLQGADAEETSNFLKRIRYFRPSTYCNTCLIDLKDKEALLNHNSEAHGKERDGKYRCFGCGKLLCSRKARLNHENHMCVELEYGFKCKICGRNLPFRGTYERHVNHHRLNKIKDVPDDSAGIFKCDKCDERFTRRSEWHKHTLKHRREGILAKICERTSKQRQNREKESRLPKRNPYERSSTYCNTCFIDLKDKEAYLNHNVEAHGIERDGKCRCFGCGRLFNHKHTRFAHESYSCKSLEFGYKCNICGRHLPLRGSYERHLNHHRLNKIKDLPDDSGGIFKCEKCNERFTARSVWQKHMYKHRMDDNKKDYICETCGKVFTRQNYLNVHAGIHSTTKRYKCDICGYRSVQKQNLTIHMRKHTNERPYACDLCPQRCVSASNLLAHKRRHLGIRKFQCSICNKKFGYKQSLSDHIAIKHQKSQCNTCRICGAEYALKSGLRRHLKKKHPEDNYLNKHKPKNSDQNTSMNLNHIADDNGQIYPNNFQEKNEQVVLYPNNVQEKNGQEVLYPNDGDKNEQILYSNVNDDLNKGYELNKNSNLNIPQQDGQVFNLNIGENERFVCFEKSFNTKDGENMVIVLQEQE